MRPLALVLWVVAACDCAPTEDVRPILPPANGEAGPLDLPDAGRLGQDECIRRCDAGDVSSCSFDEPGGVPTLHCVLPSPCE